MAVYSYKCPHCTAPLKFNADSQNFVCEYCSSVFTKEELDEIDSKIVAEAEKEEPKEEQSSNSEFHGNVYTCPSCGAQIVTDDTTAATFCFYCHNVVVFTEKLTGGLTPDKIIPFKVSRETAVNKFKELCSKKKFLPSDFLSDKHIEKMSGVYFPYWYVDAEADGKVYAKSRDLRVWHAGDIEYTETSEYGHYREGRVSIKSIAEVALKKSDMEMMEYVCPFDDSGLVDFDMSYLSGFQAEKRDIEKEGLEAEVTDEIRKITADRLESTITKAGAKVKDSSSAIRNTLWKYVLLPVWVLTYDYNGKKYIYALNGQTGKVFGELPVSKSKLTGLFFGAAVIAAAIAGVIGGLLLW